MNEVRARIRIGSDHRISGLAPPEVPPGEHEVTISLRPIRKRKNFRLADLPMHQTPWDGSISLRREDMYGDDGR